MVKKLGFGCFQKALHVSNSSRIFASCSKFRWWRFFRTVKYEREFPQTRRIWRKVRYNSTVYANEYIQPPLRYSLFSQLSYSYTVYEYRPNDSSRPRNLKWSRYGGRWAKSMRGGGRFSSGGTGSGPGSLSGLPAMNLRPFRQPNADMLLDRFVTKLDSHQRPHFKVYLCICDNGSSVHKLFMCGLALYILHPHSSLSLTITGGTTFRLAGSRQDNAGAHRGARGRLCAGRSECERRPIRCCVRQTHRHGDYTAR